MGLNNVVVVFLWYNFFSLFEGNPVEDCGIEEICRHIKRAGVEKCARVNDVSN